MGNKLGNNLWLTEKLGGMETPTWKVLKTLKRGKRGYATRSVRLSRTLASRQVWRCRKARGRLPFDSAECPDNVHLLIYRQYGGFDKWLSYDNITADE
jgi:hypothetical protein